MPSVFGLSLDSGIIQRLCFQRSVFRVRDLSTKLMHFLEWLSAILLINIVQFTCLLNNETTETYRTDSCDSSSLLNFCFDFVSGLLAVVGNFVMASSEFKRGHGQSDPSLDLPLHVCCSFLALSFETRMRAWPECPMELPMACHIMYCIWRFILAIQSVCLLLWMLCGWETVHEIPQHLVPTHPPDF